MRSLVLGALGALSLAASASEPSVHPRLRDCALPPEIQERWERNEIPDARLTEVLDHWRATYPELYGVTAAPPAGSRLIPDHAPMERLHLVLPGWRDHDDTYVKLVDMAARHGLVTANVFSASDLPRLRKQFERLKTPMENVTLVAESPVDTIWMRDFGPVPLQTPTGVGLLDFGYAPDCTNDDAYPALVAAPGQPVYRSSLYLDGGNLLTDGAGTCFVTSSVLRENTIDEASLREELSRMAGCEDLVVLEPLHGQLAEHVDVLLTPAPDGVLLLASFAPEEDAANHGVMVRNRARLERLAAARHWTLVDLPAPPPVRSEGKQVVRTFNNVLPFNGVLLVPDFLGVPTERVVTAWTRLQAAYPGRELRSVPVDVLMPYGGAVHCIARATPAFVPPAPVPKGP